jgi:hypothetical protein
MNKLILKKHFSNKPDQNILFKYKQTIFSLMCQGILFYNKFFYFSFFCTGFTIINFIREGRHQKTIQHLLDTNFTQTKNARILLAFRELKKYVLLHPELKQYFPEKSTQFMKMCWCKYLGNEIGTGFRHDETLKDKRWEITCELINDEMNTHARFYSIVLFHSPSNFEIEYLRVDTHLPFPKRYTIIDGRRDAKAWIEEMEEQKVDKRMHPKYREDEKVKY